MNTVIYFCMALIKCKECKKEISDSAKQCPHCGYKKKKIGFFWPIIMILILIGYFGEDEITKNSKEEKTEKKITTPTKKINKSGRAKLVAQYTDPGYVESSFPQDESFWIKIKSPPTGQSAEIYAQVVCRQAKNDYNTSGFTITIWGLLDNKKYGKARCY